MKNQTLLLGAAALAGTLLTGCGGDNHPSGGSASTSSSSSSSSSGGSSSSGTTMMSLDTAQVLALAQVQSETASAFAVDDGALTLDDTSESTTPIAVSPN